MIRWLHISDLHLGDEDTSSCRMREQLPDLIRKVGQFDYIFLTGDIRTANATPNCFTDQMAEFILELCKACGLSTERLFIVPGNHDVNRDAAGRHEAIQKVWFKWDGYYDPNKGKINPEESTAIWGGQLEFRDFLTKIYPDTRLSLYQNPLSPHFNVETEDFNILHLDSTVIYTKDQEAHDLIFGNYEVFKVLKTLNPYKPTILLTHYPITALLQDERNQISLILQEQEVRLWLAGHEHDKVLMPYGYLRMLQAGELRYEEKAIASVLIGEYDPATFECQVRAFHWFKEGWAKYPLVDLDAENKEVYCFSLKSYSEKHTPSLLNKTRQINSIALTRLSQKFDSRILPKLESEYESDDITGLLKEAWEKGLQSIILLGDGGMGKTTLLLNHCITTSVPTLYVSAEQLTGLGIGLEDFCVRTLCDGDTNKFSNILRKGDKHPTLRIIIDGLNEISPSDERSIIRELQRLQFNRGIQFIVASRSDFSKRYNLHSFSKVRVCSLDEDVLQTVFTAEEWAEINKYPNLKRLLKNPLLVTIYKQFSSVLEDYGFVEFLNWRTPAQTSTYLFHNYYLAQIALMMQRADMPVEKVILAFVCINWILPAIAYRYEIGYSISRPDADFRNILHEAISSFSEKNGELTAIREHFREYNTLNLSESIVSDILIEDLHLLHRENGLTSFSHQMHRDYLSALYIANESKFPDNILDIWNIRLFPTTISNHIRLLSDNYWHGIALVVKGQSVGRTDTRILNQNLFRCFPPIDTESLPDYSQLNLTDNRLPNLQLYPEKVSLKLANVSHYSLGLQQKTPPPIHLISLSEERHFLAAVSDSFLTIYNLPDGSISFKYNLGKRTTQLIFFNDYLLLNAGCIIVFKFDSVWKFVGEINEPKPSVFTSQLKAIRADGNIIELYYKKAQYSFNIDDCTLISFQQKQFDPKSLPPHSDLWRLRQSVDLRAISKITDVSRPVSSFREGEFSANSFIDGRIEIYEGEEIIQVIGEKIPILKDASISADGRFIVTLSGEVFGLKRRIIIWDVNQRRKTSEIFCDAIINRVDLSENGKWILGRSQGTKLWCYNIDSQSEKIIDGNFLSSQSGKLTTIGDEILLKTEQGIEYYNLSTEHTTLATCPVNNPRLVSPLNNDTLAGVTQSRRTLKIVSDRDNSILNISPARAEIVNIQALKGKPFIGVQDITNTISIYHTGTGQRTRILDTYYPIHIIAFHPDKPYIAYSDGKRNLTIASFIDKIYYRKPLGQWYRNDMKRDLDSRIIDMAFNADDKSLILVLANGTIMYLDETSCQYKYSTYIITAINPDAYDFSEIIASDEVKDIINRNRTE